MSFGIYISQAKQNIKSKSENLLYNSDLPILGVYKSGIITIDVTSSTTFYKNLNHNIGYDAMLIVYGRYKSYDYWYILPSELPFAYIGYKNYIQFSAIGNIYGRDIFPYTAEFKYYIFTNRIE